MANLLDEALANARTAVAGIKRDAATWGMTTALARTRFPCGFPTPANATSGSRTRHGRPVRASVRGLARAQGMGSGPRAGPSRTRR
jgi:hypothetical protein